MSPRPDGRQAISCEQDQFATRPPQAAIEYGMNRASLWITQVIGARARRYQGAAELAATALILT